MRTNRGTYLMDLARRAAVQTTCIRRGVGCVLADHRGQVLAIAYNGVASGQPHCNEGCHPNFPNACAGYWLPPGQDECEAVHAEQNALVQCPTPDLIHTAYVTRMPCPGCTKLLLNTGCRRIVFGEPHNGKSGQDLWQKAGRE